MMVLSNELIINTIYTQNKHHIKTHQNIINNTYPKYVKNWKIK